MDDAMIDAMADDVLRERLGAFADARLSPDLATTARMRSRVLAVAHRDSARVRSDATLALVPGPAPTTHVGQRRPARTTPAVRRVTTIGLAAALALGVVAGSVAAARPGGPLYDTRIWAESLALPTDPSQRAVAEIHRLDARTNEAADAGAAGDRGAAEAALRAYERILAEASTDAYLADDPVASAALQAGVARNIERLTGLAARLPAPAAAAIQAAVQRALERSDSTIDAIQQGRGDGNGPGSNSGNGNGPDGNSGNGNGPGNNSGNDGKGNGPGANSGNGNGPGSNSGKQATPKPAATPKPEKTPNPNKKPSPNSEATPRPTPRGQSQGGGQGGGGGD